MRRTGGKGRKEGRKIGLSSRILKFRKALLTCKVTNDFHVDKSSSEFLSALSAPRTQVIFNALSSLGS